MRGRLPHPLHSHASGPHTTTLQTPIASPGPTCSPTPVTDPRSPRSLDGFHARAEWLQSSGKLSPSSINPFIVTRHDSEAADGGHAWGRGVGLVCPSSVSLSLHLMWSPEAPQALPCGVCGGFVPWTRWIQSWAVGGG